MMETFYYICNFLNTSAQIWFVLQLLGGMFEVKTAKKRIYVGQAVIIGGVALFKCGNEYYISILFSNNMMILIALLVAVCGKLLYKYHLFHAFCMGTLGLGLLALIDFFIQTSISMILEEQGRDKYLLLSVSTWRGCYLLASALVLLPVGICMGNWLARWRKEVFRYRKQGVFLIIPLLVCMVYFQNIYIFYDSEQLLNHWKLFILGIVLLGVLFWLYTVKKGTDEIVRIQQLKIEMLENNYLSLQQMYNEKAVLIHDMKNHMYVIRDILEREEVSKAQAFVGEIVGELRRSGNVRWTRHEMLDFILNRKIQEACQAGITVKCECDDMRGLVLTTMEICTLFANLLDNEIGRAHV